MYDPVEAFLGILNCEVTLNLIHILERRSIPIMEKEPELALDEESPVEARLSGGQTPGGGGP